MNKFVRVFIKNKEGKFLLIHEKNKGWVLPGGKVENHEWPNGAYIREIDEELNLIVSSGGEIFRGEFVHFDEIWEGYFFTATVKNIEEITIKEPEKCDQFNWFSIEELIKLEEHLRDLYSYIKVALMKGFL